MRLDQRLIDTAVAFVNARFPGEGWAGCAAMYTEDGQVLVSTAPETLNDSVALCHETGAICEAHKLDKRVTASVCVSRDDQGRFHILTPCGVCQERLMVWGDDVEVAVPKPEDSAAWEARRLADVQPYYWRRPFLRPAVPLLSHPVEAESTPQRRDGLEPEASRSPVAPHSGHRPGDARRS